MCKTCPITRNNLRTGIKGWETEPCAYECGENTALKYPLTPEESIKRNFWFEAPATHLEMVKNVTKSVAKVAVAAANHKVIKASKETEQQRINICTTCELFENNRCKKCGCYLAAKRKIATESCPIGKWGQET